MVNKPKNNILDKLFVGLLLVIFGGIIFHTPITVYLSSNFPEYTLLIKSWKEILMLLAGLVALLLVFKNNKREFFKEPLISLIGCFGLLCIVLSIFSTGNSNQILAGMIIDLRYLFYFVLVYFALKMYPDKKQTFINIGIAGAVIVTLFGMLQATVLPKDILANIGYGEDTIMPYMTVDKDDSFIRINSTMRGPNPLGAYCLIALGLVAAYFCKLKDRLNRNKAILIAAISLGGTISIISSYSRSAWLGLVIAVLIMAIVCFRKKFSTKLWIIIFTILSVTCVGLMTFVKSDLISSVLLHDSPETNNSINSNDQHISSLTESFGLMISQPLGSGIGSTGSASMLGDNPLIIENQYLFTAHETGWLGLVLFLSIYAVILFKLWNKRSDWLCLGVFATGVGLFVIGMLLPVFVDDIVSIIWWGLAAIALADNKKMKVAT